MVYCGGLENRFGLTADGGSNPSLSAKEENMNDIIWILVWVVVVGGLFAWMWRAGHLLKLSHYIHQTREELRKCSWPTWDELKGSTALIAVCMILLGAFTFAVDQILFHVFTLFKL